MLDVCKLKQWHMPTRGGHLDQGNALESSPRLLYIYNNTQPNEHRVCILHRTHAMPIIAVDRKRASVQAATHCRWQISGLLVLPL